MLAILHLLAVFVADPFKPRRQLEVETSFFVTTASRPISRLHAEASARSYAGATPSPCSSMNLLTLRVRRQVDDVAAYSEPRAEVLGGSVFSRSKSTNQINWDT